MIVRLTFDVLIKHFNRVFYLTAFECAYTCVCVCVFGLICSFGHSHCKRIMSPTPQRSNRTLFSRSFSFFCQLSHSLNIHYLCLITFDLSIPFVPNFLCSAFIQPSVFSPSTLNCFAHAALFCLFSFTSQCDKVSVCFTF